MAETGNRCSGPGGICGGFAGTPCCYGLCKFETGADYGYCPGGYWWVHASTTTPTSGFDGYPMYHLLGLTLWFIYNNKSVYYVACFSFECIFLILYVFEDSICLLIGFTNYRRTKWINKFCEFYLVYFLNWIRLDKSMWCEYFSSKGVFVKQFFGEFLLKKSFFFFTIPI